MTRDSILAARHLAMEESLYQHAIQTHPVNIQIGEIKEPKVEFYAGDNNYDEWDLKWMGLDPQRQKSGLICVIPVVGSLAPSWNYNGTNTQWLSRQIEIALGNDLVSGIVLNGMSGGGTVAGTLTAAESVRKGQILKPITGFVTGMVASAAYWIFSQTQEIYLESAVSTAVGSLGIMGVFASEAEHLKNDGIDVRVLRSKGSEDKNVLHPAEPINEEALKEEQKVIDAMRVEFLNSVMAARPQITKDPGGKLYYGKEAIKMGLADGVASLQDVIKRTDYLARKRIAIS